MPIEIISKILDYLDMSRFQTHLQLQLISKRWYLTSIDSEQKVWHSFLFNLHDVHLPQLLDSDRFELLKSAKFYVGGYFIAEENWISQARRLKEYRAEMKNYEDISAQISKHNK